MSNTILTDEELISAVSNPSGKKSFTVIYLLESPKRGGKVFLDTIDTFSLNANTKVEAGRLGREYCARILGKQFYSVF